MRISILLAGCLILAGCDLAPDYKVPVTPVPAAYKEAAAGSWVAVATQNDLPQSAWWALFGDPTLSDLENRLESASPDLAQALARYDAARGYVEEAAASFLPTVSLDGHADTDKQSANRPLRSPNQPTYYGDDMLGLGASWDLDLWGKVRNMVAAGRDLAAASYADLAAVRLSLDAQLADDYLSLRGLDAQAQLLSDTTDVYAKALQLTNDRHDKGIASGLDVERARTQLSDAQAQSADVAARRALLEHAIASLVGEAASSFSIAPATPALNLPNVPAGLPATLLQRRPDVAAAERRVAASNASIGVARAAFFPDISLSALIGFQGTGNDALFNAPDAFWAVGPNMAMTLFDAGRNEGNLAVAKAANAGAVAAYRAAVLKAFQDVEDNQALLNHLADEARAKNASVAAAGRTADLATALYRNGALGFLDVVVAQTTALSARQAALSIQTSRLEASVGLIRALGGGWTAPDLPDVADGKQLLKAGSG